MNKVITSNGRSGLCFLTSNTSIYLKVLPSVKIFSDSFVILFDNNNNEITRVIYVPGRDIVVDISTVQDGMYSLCLYVKSHQQDNLYYSYIQFGEIQVRKTWKSVDIITSNTVKDNNRFYSSLFSISRYDSRLLSSTPFIQSTNLNICNLAKQIAEGLHDKLSIIRAVHAWVALNLSYDYDSLNNDAHVNKDNTALGAYVGRRCVCRGYTNLTIALLRSLRIPAIMIFCNAENAEKRIKGNTTEQTKSVNHVFPAAWDGTRWILMDTTWDSKNIYEHGQDKCGRDVVYPYKYFDVTIEYISNSHNFISYDF